MKQVFNNIDCLRYKVPINYNIHQCPEFSFVIAQLKLDYQDGKAEVQQVKPTNLCNLSAAF